MAEATVVVEGLSEFLRALKRYTPEVRKEFAKQARAAVGVIVADARTRASWSSRIPGAISATVAGKYVGVRVSKRKAPHGPLYERGGTGNTGVVRHPLFGNRSFWYSTPVRPFLKPAVDANKDRAIEAMLEAVESARGKVGLRER